MDLYILVGFPTPYRWWRRRATIPLPPACKAGALPIELLPHTGRAIKTRPGTFSTLVDRQVRCGLTSIISATLGLVQWP